jgi:predicted TIM-barrel fold metal-dependent hydrolase
VVSWLGADQVIIGSDWPHMEGTTAPRDIIEECARVDLEGQEKILYTNTKQLNELRPA